MGLQWKSWNGEVLLPHGTAYEGQFYAGRLDQGQQGPDSGAGASASGDRGLAQGLQRPFARGTDVSNFRKGETEGPGGARLGKEFPGVADSSKDTQSVLRQASVQTTGDVYMQKIDKNVVQAVNSRTDAVLGGLQISTEKLAVPGKKLKPPNAIRRSPNWRWL